MDNRESAPEEQHPFGWVALHRGGEAAGWSRSHASRAQMRERLEWPGLTHMHRECILMHMRTTLNIEDGLLNRATKLTGVKEKTALVRLGLEALIALESGRRLAALGGTEKQLLATPRRRSDAA